jgi:hypothetical protein
MNPFATVSRTVKLTLGVALSTFLVGCSGGSTISGTVPVSGKVTYKGQPVSGASVTFIGEGEARSAAAMTTADGSYKLMTLDSEGAVPGKYRVVVDKTELPAELSKDISMEEAAANANKPTPAPKKLLPERYSDPTKTPLNFEVKGGVTNYDIELTET